MPNPAFENPITDYDFGDTFDYSVWTMDSEIRLCNVPWDSAYRDIVEFETQDDLNAYIDRPGGFTVSAMSVLKPLEGIRLPITHNMASRYNYIRAYNPAMPVNSDVPRYFYYFITGVTYLSPEVTELTLQLDVWQSYGRDVVFGNCYIERGHIGIANALNFQNFGRDYLTVPEGLDTGSEYQTIATRREVVMGQELIFSGGQLTSEDNTCVIILTTQDITANPGTKADPNRVTSKGSTFQGIASGASYWAFENQNSFKNWMTSVSETPWVGESVITAILAPKIDRYIDGFTWQANGVPTSLNGTGLIPLRHYLFDAWRDSAEILNNIPARYRHLKKFLTFPYMVIELTTWTGTPIMIKPELWASDNANVLERVNLVAPNQRIEFHPQRYNSRPGQAIDNYGELPDSVVDALPAAVRERYRDVGDDHGDYWDHATKITNLPQLVMVNDGAISYLASNTHGIAYSRDSASWDQTRALQSNNAQYDTASNAIRLAEDLTAMGNASAALQVGNQNRTDVAQGIVSGAASTLGGIVGGGFGATNIGIGAVNNLINSGASLINTGIGIAARDESLAISNAQNTNATARSNQSAEQNRDRNKSLADWAANGDYSNKIAGINAKVNDARMIAPNTSGQVGGETMNLANNMVQVSARWKMVDNANMRRIGDYWLKFGYAVNQVVRVNQLMVMDKFSFWKMVECSIVVGPMPEIFKDAIRAIFEKGTTVYADPTDIGLVNIADNPAKAGITI